MAVRFFRAIRICLQGNKNLAGNLQTFLLDLRVFACVCRFAAGPDNTREPCVVKDGRHEAGALNPQSEHGL